MERRIFVCDLCGVQQEITNHWFSVGITWANPCNGGATLTLAELNSPYKTHADELVHLCGEKCVTRKVSQFVSKLLDEILRSEVKEAVDSTPAESSNS